MPSSPLLPEELELLDRARQLVPHPLPSPWSRRTNIPASGIVAGGWNMDEQVLLVSADGYSLTDPHSGKQLARNRDPQLATAALSITTLTFTSGQGSVPIPVFGANGGDGIHAAPDGWRLETIAPWWPQEAILLREPHAQGSGPQRYFNGAHLLDLSGLDPVDLKCGFSPSGLHILVLCFSGAVVFSRASLSM